MILPTLLHIDYFLNSFVIEGIGMKIRFTSASLTRIGAPNAGFIYISDRDTPNLLLRVSSSGRKTFVWRGRVNGALKSHTLGPYPKHSIRSAQDWADDIGVKRDLGINAIEERKENEAAVAIAALRTCDWLWDLYMWIGVQKGPR